MLASLLPADPFHLAVLGLFDPAARSVAPLDAAGPDEDEEDDEEDDEDEDEDEDDLDDDDLDDLDDEDDEDDEDTAEDEAD